MGVRPSYTRAVALAGGAPALIPLETDEVALRAVYNRLDGIVLSGGGDISPDRYGAAQSPYTTGVDTNRDEADLRLARWAVEDDKPLLCICRGTQVLNVAMGGTLFQDIREQVPGALRHDSPAEDEWFMRTVHPVEVSTASYLADVMGLCRISVNSLHHQALDRIGSGLRVVANAPDGIIEGIEHPERRFVIGVQWHPEALAEQMEPMRRLFSALVSAAAKSR